MPCAALDGGWRAVGVAPVPSPALRLVVDRADAGTEMLLPATDTRNVTVQTYRKLTWGGRVGLLVEAA